jgi:hypothetical protein
MSLYFEGQKIESDGLTIAIRRQSYMPDRIVAQPRLPESPVEIGTNIDIDAYATQQTIAKIISNIAKNVAPKLLLPRARDLADDLGLDVKEWRISVGRRILGSCTSKGVISLSCMNVFLTQELRDYIVWHELAHLTEMNHSPRFHALCNQYCGDREAELRGKLRLTKWPLPMHRR